MPNYKEKIMNPLTDKQFLNGMAKGKFIEIPEHKGLIALLYYSGVRISEALTTRRLQFRVTDDILYYDVKVPHAETVKTKLKNGKSKWVPTGRIIYGRLKHSNTTPPLPIALSLPYVDCIVESIEDLEPQDRVWPYCRKTGYNIVNRVFAYPHYHRLSRITQFFLDGFSIAEVRSWTGLSLKALDYYVGLVGIDRMGRSLKSEANTLPK